MEMLKKDTPVKIRNTIHSGVVKRMKLSDDGETVHFLVGYEDVDGNATERYFDIEQIEVVTETEGAAG